MKKNNIIGFALIAVILVGFYWYNARIFKEQEKEQQRLDSIARVETQVREQQRAAEQAALPVVGRDSVTGRSVGQGPAIEQVVASVYGNKFLDSASAQEEHFYTLENDLIKVQFSNKGAKPFSVLIKKYQTYDGGELLLFDGAANEFSMQFYTTQQLNTSHFFFTPVDVTPLAAKVRPVNDTTLRMRLYLDSLAYVEYEYTLRPNTYMVDLNIHFMGVQKYIPKNITQLDLNWKIDIPRMEKGYDNEKNYSTIAYKYPNNEDVEDMGLRKTENSERLKTKLEWVAFQQQFFSAILVAPNNFSSGDLTYLFYPAEDPDQLLMHCEASLQMPFDAASTESLPLQFYFGPNHFKTLKSYDRAFEKIVPLGGWGIGWINRYLIIPVFNFLGKYIGNYGIIILILTIILKIILFYPNHKSYVSSAKMRVLRPEVEKINEKYPKKEDAMKKQQETMALYKKTGVNMFGGCLPMLLQMPILFAMFRFFPSSFELRQEHFLWATDLSSYDSILQLPFSIPLYGDHVSLFALLMGISMFFYSRMNIDQMNTGGQQMPGMKEMTLYFMPVFFTLICNSFSSGLSYYYMLSNVITMIQTWVIRKYFVDEDKILAQLQAKAASNSNQPQKKSKFQQRLDEAYKLQQQRQQGKRK